MTAQTDQEVAVMSAGPTTITGPAGQYVIRPMTDGRFASRCTRGRLAGSSWETTTWRHLDDAVAAAVQEVSAR